MFEKNGQKCPTFDKRYTFIDKEVRDPQAEKLQKAHPGTQRQQFQIKDRKNYESNQRNLNITSRRTTIQMISS